MNHNFVIFGQSVCPEAWRTINSVSVNTFYDIIDRLKEGHRNVSHGNVQLRKSQRSMKATMAIGWMQKKFDAIRDLMPDRDEVNIA